MIENKEARKKTGSLCRKVARNKERKKEVILSFGLSTWNKRKPSVNLYGWNEIKMYHKKIITMKKETLYVAFSTQKGGVPRIALHEPGAQGTRVHQEGSELP